jgi:hypothetical protein
MDALALPCGRNSRSRGRAQVRADAACPCGRKAGRARGVGGGSGCVFYGRRER